MFNGGHDKDDKEFGGSAASWVEMTWAAVVAVVVVVESSLGELWDVLTSLPFFLGVG